MDQWLKRVSRRRKRIIEIKKVSADLAVGYWDTEEEVGSQVRHVSHINIFYKGVMWAEDFLWLSHDRYSHNDVIFSNPSLRINRIGRTWVAKPKSSGGTYVTIEVWGYTHTMVRRSIVALF